ncbi:MAG: hydrogenase maturation protease [Bryobacteraceae bacterium]
MAEATGEDKPVIAALGNPLMGDDGAGAAVLEELRRRGVEERARLCEVGAAGVDLLLVVEHAGALVILDAMASGDPPGVVRVFTGEELFACALSRGGGSHRPSLTDTLRLGRQLGLLPPRIALVGIAAKQFEPGAGLSPEVAAAVPEAAARALQLLEDGPSPD